MRGALLGAGLWAWGLAASAHADGLALAAEEAAAAADATATEAAHTEGSGGPALRWEDGETILTMDQGEVRMSHRLQMRFLLDNPDEDVRLPGTTDPGQSKAAFRISRAKSEFQGWFWKKQLTYDVQLSWAGPEEGVTTQTPLEDLYLNYEASASGMFQVRFGQFKQPFGRQLLTTSNKLQFTDRSVLAGIFTRGRDLGVMLWGTTGSKKFEWRVAASNGNAASRNQNDNTKFAYDARVQLQPFGDLGYAESDFESKDKALLAFGLQVESNDQRGTSTSFGGQGVTDYNLTSLGADVTLKYRGVFVFGEFFNRHQAPDAGESFDAKGWNVQAGVFVKRDIFEIAGRYAGYDPTDSVSDNNVKEWGGIANYYILKHRFKIQAEYREIKNDDQGSKFKEFRAQTYVQF